MKLLFIAEGFIIPLGTSEIEYTLSSPIFSPLSGEWSYPFTLQSTDEILAFFKYPHLPNALREPEKTYRVQLLEGNALFAEGDFTLDYSDVQIITATLTATPGNINQKIWTKKLNTFELGSDTIGTINSNNTVYPLDGTSFIGTKFDIFRQNNNTPVNLTDALLSIYGFSNKLKVYKNDIQIFADVVEIPLGNYSPTLADQEAALIKTLDRFNASQNQNQLYYQKKQFIGIFTGVSTDKLKIKFSFLEGTQDTDAILVMKYTIEAKTVKTITNAYDESLKNTWNKPYYFPEVSSLKHYTQSSVFQGIINKTIDGKIQRNGNILTEKTKYSIVPMFRLAWILRKIFTDQGYTITGTFFLNPDIQKALIFNLFTTDKLVDGISFPINIHNPTIIYANHLPNETLADYMQMLVDEFGLSLTFNPLLKTLDMSFFDDILQETEYLDLTGRISSKYRNNHQKAKKTQITWTLQDDALAKDETAPYISVPTKAIVEAQKEEFDTINLKILGLTKNTNNLPQIEASGISPLFEQAKNTNPLRFIFWENNIGKIETATLCLDLTRATGIYERFLKNKIAFQSKTVNLEAAALMTLPELMSFNFKRKILAFGVFWLASSLSVKLRSNYQAYRVELKLKRFNY